MKKKYIYPMSMLNEVVGNEEKVASEIKEQYEFNRDEPYFQYEEGVILESLTEELAEFANGCMGLEFYGKEMSKVA